MNSKKFGQQLEGQWKRLYRVAYAWCHDPQLAMDLTQETLAKALKRQHQLKDVTAMKSWLFTILLNHWRDHCRQHQEMIDIEEMAVMHDRTPERESENMEALDRVRLASARLNQDQREVLSLVVLEGLSYAETAVVLGISNGTVMSRLCRARENLRGQLQRMDQLVSAPSAAVARIRRVK